MNCLNLRPHAKSRISLRRVRRDLLGECGGVIHAHGAAVETNALDLIEQPEPVRETGKPELTIVNATIPEDRSGQLYRITVGQGVFSSIEKMSATKEKATEKGPAVFDADGGTVVAGLCDAHMHLMVGAERLRGLDIEDVHLPGEFRRRIRQFAAANPDLPALHVYGLHYFDPPLIPAESARKTLDDIIDDRPLFIYAHDLHTGWANTRALEVAGMLKPMPPFPHLIERLGLKDNFIIGADGLPSGELREPDVYFMVEGPLRQKFPLSAEKKLDHLRRTLMSLAEKGLTSVHNMGLALPEEDIELLLLLLELEVRGELPIKVHCAYSVVPDEHMLTDIGHAAIIRDKIHEARRGSVTANELHDFLLLMLAEVSEMRNQHCHEVAKRDPALSNHHHLPFIHGESTRIRDHIHNFHVAPHVERKKRGVPGIQGKKLDRRGKFDVGGVKIFMDGVIEKDTAFVVENPPRPGVPAFNQEELDELVFHSDRAGLQVAGHCIGDGSVKAMLDAISEARAKNQVVDQRRGHSIRHRIEHIEICRPEDIQRFIELNTTPSMQPLHERPPTTMWHEKTPKRKWGTAFAWRSLLDTGSRLAFGSDWPIVSCDCMEAMRRAVEREPWMEGLPDQHLEPEEVFESFSAHPAYLEYREKLKGRLIPGMSADITIMSENIHEVPIPKLDRVKPIRVYSNGELIYTGG